MQINIRNSSTENSTLNSPPKPHNSSRLQYTPTGLPLVFFPKPQKINYWNEIAYSILRSIHAEDSFAKNSHIKFKKKKLLEDNYPDLPVVTHVLSEILETKEKEKIHELSEYSPIKSRNFKKIQDFNLLKRKTTGKTEKNEVKNNEKTSKDHSFSLIKNNEFLEEEDPENSHFLNLKEFGRRKTSYGKFFGFPTKLQQKTGRFDLKFKTQMDKKKEELALSVNGEFF